MVELVSREVTQVEALDLLHEVHLGEGEGEGGVGMKLRVRVEALDLLREVHVVPAVGHEREDDVEEAQRRAWVRVMARARARVRV